MKRALLIIFLLGSFVTPLLAQCPYDNQIYLSGAAPTVVGNSVVAQQTWAGEFNRVTGMVAGNTYRISTCGTNSFDSEITIYPANGGSAIAYDDDGCGVQGGPSSIDFIPPVTGDYDLLLDQFPCSDNQTDMDMTITLIATVGGGGTSTADLTIPVVVHVVYNTPGQNISDAQIASQIAVMNEDYRKLNSDISLVPSVFGGVAADFKIEFCLADRDPSGAVTTGITRTQTSVTEFGVDNLMKSAATGGHDPWNPQKYLNLWVCNLGGGVLGYAQFPADLSTSPQTDGVVIGYTYFGTTGTATAPFNKGRTATHEVGHWLNLRHIWGDDNCGDDFVSDTPTQEASNAQCPSFPHITCSNGPNGDMFMNYMDYVDDACMQMFTEGQKTRAWASINLTRSQLATSQGCSTVGIEEQALSEIRLFPNPTTGQLRIDATALQGESLWVEVLDGTGRQVLPQQVIDNSMFSLELGHLADGMYLVRFSGDAGAFMLRRIVLQR
jgi:hypothetical protein